jgi:hypothetical protein
MVKQSKMAGKHIETVSACALCHLKNKNKFPQIQIWWQNILKTLKKIKKRLTIIEICFIFYKT